MKLTKRVVYALLFGCLAMFILFMLPIIGQTNAVYAVAESAQTMSHDFVVIGDGEDVAATYEFVILSDSECAVRLTNKDTATRAVVPSTAKINGESYTVTQVYANGFMSATKLKKVILPNTIKQINNMAFANCTALQSITMANVEVIGNMVFFNCSSLTELTIPKSVETVGTYILRNSDTQVRVRAESAAEGWSSNWNSNNANQNVQYGSTYIEPLVLEPVYNTVARSASSELIGYALSEGQPRTDNFYYEISESNAGEFYVGQDIFIPAQYNGMDILKIKEGAFLLNNFSQLIIEYSDAPIIIEATAFAFTLGDSIVINRDVEFGNSKDNIFTGSAVSAIILPNTISQLPEAIFAGCTNLTSISFITPAYIADRADMLQLVDQHNSNGVVYLPTNSDFDTISLNAFQDTKGISELHIYDNVINMGSYVLAEWNDDAQTVFVHNQTPIEEKNWDEQWNGEFETVNYDKTFYKINLNPNGGALSISYVYVENGGVVNIPAPVYKGHYLVGWYTDGGVQFTNTTFTGTQDIHLTAKWMCEITLNNLGGSGETSFVRIYSGQKLPEIKVPQKRLSKFRGYFTEPNGGGVQYYGLSDSDRTVLVGLKTYTDNGENVLYADWDSVLGDADTYTVDKNVTYLNLNGFDKIILKLPSVNFNKPCHIVIPSSVSVVGIYAEYYRQYDLYITINARGTDFDLVLENFEMVAPVMTSSDGTATTYDTISMTTTYNSALNLYINAQVKIYGSTAKPISGYTYDGSYAIKCSKLVLCEVDKLWLCGGYGSNSTRNSDAVSTSDITYLCDESNVKIYDR